MLLHIYSSRRNFFVFIKISYLQPFREIMGGQRIRKFSAKMTPQAKKMTFFRIFFLLLHIFTSRRNFFVITKISYLQPFREIMGGQGKSVTSTTTNKRQRRTTLTIIIARQDSFRILGLIHIGNIFKKMIKSRKKQRHNTFSFSIFSQKNMKGLPP